MNSLKARLKDALPYLGYVGFFVTAFFFAYLTFPYDRLRDYVVAQANSQQQEPGKRRELRIGEMSLRPLLGVKLEDVEVRRFDNAGDSDPSVMRADMLKVSASAWSLLFGNVSYDFEGEVGEGSFEGSYEQDGDEVHISVEFDEVDLATAGIGSALGFPLEGKLSGEAELTLPAFLSDLNNGQPHAPQGCRTQ